MAKVLTHAERKDPEYKQAIAGIRTEVQADFEKLEELKPSLQKRHQRYLDSLRRIEAAKAERKEQRAAAAQSGRFDRRDEVEASLEDDTNPYGSSKLLNAGEHTDLALALALRASRRTGPGRSESHTANDLTQEIRDLGRRLDRATVSRHDEQPSQQRHYSYPSVNAGDQRLSSVSQTGTYSGAEAPQRPPKDVLVHQSSLSARPPTLPPKSNLTAATQPPPLPVKPHQGGFSELDSASRAELSSHEYTFKPAAFSESGAPLRTLFLPAELRTRFLSIASSNTQRKLETCGILCGTLLSNALFISHLVIPDQKSTSDTCDTTDEGDSELFDYVDGQQLMVCGWIHTHPTQTCFLSSRDLHTSVGYQVMLPESIAIVCAPSQQPE